MRRHRTLLLLVSLSSLYGCAAHAHLSDTHEGGGQAHLHGPFMAAVSEARLLAVEHCQGRVALDEPTRQDGRVAFRCVTPTGGAAIVKARRAQPTDGMVRDDAQTRVAECIPNAKPIAPEALLATAR